PPTPRSPPSPYTTLFRAPKKRKKKRSVFIPVLLGITVAFAVACACLCFMILRNANNMFTDQKADIVLEDFVGMTRAEAEASAQIDRKSTRLNSSHVSISY